jgi:hypothetical protein
MLMRPFTHPVAFPDDSVLEDGGKKGPGKGKGKASGMTPGETLWATLRHSLDAMDPRLLRVLSFPESKVGPGRQQHVLTCCCCYCYDASCCGCCCWSWLPVCACVVHPCASVSLPVPMGQVVGSSTVAVRAPDPAGDVGTLPWEVVSGLVTNLSRALCRATVHTSVRLRGPLAAPPRPPPALFTHGRIACFAFPR